ncbi:energy-coupled thiamine transporter ThiT [Clostridium chauvoei]|uniref:Energy-coupled thiamine transporter ThiT n=2 Tax=Clostridium chauvoei TaxID=46867 RepID=A0ABD4RH16_9CLOT|nr:energy-coupled thiamine transporter ThiT [Clostridium chauvoei]ATD53844.1 energy-coupled thiamine transporter ThiT [Clostridium chauvoei]ATD58352.1 energy-coupled thiamine transporter ThiT [Clostridium chauvoei]MBX7280396.1 energy-coupled thiamine transporter ThiT [Clostridium chauvoei]MBX7282881.1 energy-coupled thiamine transporter ThiT [Clostridium chauvoei]MBX7285287.1 energy-coupled thiamine transporter ThiT [Clostridium chauvoei]
MSNFISTLKESFSVLWDNPLSIVTVIGGVILLLAIIKFKNIKLDAKIMTRIGIALALATILNMIKLYVLPNGGGSISLGSMVPIILIAYMYGPQIGLLTGFLFGIISLILNPYILHPIQVLFDYPLPYMAVGFAGYFKNNKMIGTAVGMTLKFIFHFISGYVFFGAFAPEGWSPALYSLVVNGTAVGGELIICLIIIFFLPFDRIINNLSSKQASIS